MMFKGVFTAIVTPFSEDEKVDYESLKKLIEFNIKNKVAGIVPCGTTGESPTLTDTEQKKVIEFVIKTVKRRVKVIAGTGSNCTKHAVEMSKFAEKAGADACLVVNPYYNKPTQEGLYRHFKEVATSVKIPIVVYNIKGRTGVNVETETLVRLIDNCENILAVKEASGDITQIKEVISKTPENFSVLSGDDNITLDLIKVGGHGVVSVISNFVPDKFSLMVNFALEGDMKKAEELNKELDALYKIEFVETNPIPIKYMLSLKKMCEEVYRLPMCELSFSSKKQVKKLLEDMKLI
jgi:4-hydroxy-tetrahydrodipicolinate synthase